MTLRRSSRNFRMGTNGMLQVNMPNSGALDKPTSDHWDVPGNWHSTATVLMPTQSVCSTIRPRRCSSINIPRRETCVEHPLNSYSDETRVCSYESKLYRLAHKAMLILSKKLIPKEPDPGRIKTREPEVRKTPSTSCRNKDRAVDQECNELMENSELKTFRISEVLISQHRPALPRVNSDFYRIYALERIMARNGKLKSRIPPIALPSRPHRKTCDARCGIQAHIGRHRSGRQWRELTAMDFSDTEDD